VYRASDIIPDAIGTCGTSLAERVGKAMEMMGPQIMEAGGISVADVATEADYEYVTALGGSSSANSAILGILNQVDGIYQSQLSLSLRVVYQHSWSTSSEPYSSSTPSSLLDQFRSHWEANFGSVNYDLAHMWTGRDLEGSVVGIAYLGVVCNSRSYSYGISQNLNSAPAKYILTAHEIGHNFGATHTEQANPPQPNCSNTIMNSSVGTGTTFCQFSKNEVATHVSQNSSCLATMTTSNCDLNRDGQINASDIQLLVNVILAISPCPGNCDVNKDGQVNVADLQRLANVVLGISGCP
jgi:hypothetical protein